MFLAGFHHDGDDGQLSGRRLVYQVGGHGVGFAAYFFLAGFVEVDLHQCVTLTVYRNRASLCGIHSDTVAIVDNA